MSSDRFIVNYLSLQNCIKQTATFDRIQVNSAYGTELLAVYSECCWHVIAGQSVSYTDVNGQSGSTVRICNNA